jgi:hypothetical protein
VSEYRLERSLDQQTWELVAGDLTALKYQDVTVAFDLHYFYRLQAIDTSNNASGFALADAITPGFVSNTSADADTTYTSDDQLVTVLVPSGAVSGAADCAIVHDDTRKPAVNGRVVVAGLYLLMCKDSVGATVAEFSKPLVWTYQLKGKLKGLNNPTPYLYESSSTGTVIQNAKFEADGDILSFETVMGNPTYVLAAKRAGIPLDAVAIALLVLGVAGGVTVLVLRRKQRTNYDEYLRSKYYNL